MKRFLLSTIVGVFALSTAVMAGSTVAMEIDGKSAQFDVMPQIIDGRTMVPVRAIFESVGAEVQWDNNTKTVTGKKDNTTVIMTINSTVETINGQPNNMDCAPVIVDGRALAPARYVAEAFGCNVTWDSAEKIVKIETPKADAVTEDKKEEKESPETKETNKAEAPKAEANDWVKELVKADKQLTPITKDMFKNEELASANSDIRYAFEQSVLPQTLFAMAKDSEAKAELNKILMSDNAEDISNFIGAIWSDTGVQALATDFTKATNGSWMNMTEAEIDEAFTKFAEDYHIKQEETFKVTVSDIDKDTRIVVINLAEHYDIPLCKYIAIVYNQNGSIKYYTLENDPTGSYFFCYVDESSRGTLAICDNNKLETFLTAVKATIDDKVNPAATN